MKLQLSALDQHLDHVWIDEKNLQESVGIGFPAHKLYGAREAFVDRLFLGGLCFRSRLANASLLPHKRSCH